jgi:GH24 family phage-related lysozyme (muramidase)
MIPTASPRAIALIETFEIGDVTSYVPHPVWPGGASGLTIGVGYDLGYASASRIAQDWRDLPNISLIRLQSYAGRTGASAQQLQSAARDVAVPYRIAREVFETRDIPRVSSQVIASFANTENLPADCFGALVSLVFNRGNGMIDSKPGNRLEMRQIRDAMQASEFLPIPGLIRSMKRLWQGSGLNGLLARRDAEADLFEAGLSLEKSGVI